MTKKSTLRTQTYYSYLVSKKVTGYLLEAFIENEDDITHEFCFSSMEDVTDFLNNRVAYNHSVLET